MKEQVTERILCAYFANEATHHEKQLIREWLRIEGNEEIFYHHLARWEAGHLQFQPDQASANQSYRSFLRGETSSIESRVSDPDIGRKLPAVARIRFMAAAASVLFLFSVGFYLYSDYLFYDIYRTAYGVTQNIRLEDGTEVKLNAHSTLKVPKDLGRENIRKVWLDGEAFFHVAKRPAKVKFVVHTENLNVEVLGTRFNVNNRRGNTEVVLDEGSVKLYSDELNSDPVIMKPGDYVALHKEDTVFRKMAVKPEKYTAWQANKLVFEDTPLREVAEKIEDYYGVKIRLDSKQLGDRQVTGTLPNNDLEVVLKSLSASHNLEIERKTDIVIFR